MSAQVRAATCTVTVEEVDELSDREWDAALEMAPASFRFSHRAAAGRCLERAFSSYRFQPIRVGYSDGTVCLLPLIRVSRRIRQLGFVLGMPLGLEGTPIVLSGSVDGGHINSFFDTINEGMLQLSGGAGGSPPPTGTCTPFSTHVLDTSKGFDAIWRSAFTDKTRNMCRKAERSGVLVAEETGPEGARAYYSLYQESTRAWGYEEPPYPRMLIEGFVESPFSELWIARLNGSAIAGALLLRGSDDLFYWSGAMVREHRNVAPANAILRTVLESACERSIGYFDFGASGELTGVESFKRSFGASPRTYHSICLTTGAYRHLTGAIGATKRVIGRERSN